MFVLSHGKPPFRWTTRGRREVADGLEQPTMVEPADPFERGIFDSCDAAPWPTPVDHLSVVETVDRLRQSVVVAVVHTAGRRLDSGFGEPLGILDIHVL